jgi:CubicO group peptidase (beta-lactamase class C family)
VARYNAITLALALAVVLSLAWACTPQRPDLRVRSVASLPVLRFTAPDRPQRIAAVAAELDSLLAAEPLAPTASPGARETSLVFALVVDDAVVLRRARGLADVEAGVPATPETLYRIASVTKTFTTDAVLALRDRGELRLDDPIALHLPELVDARYPHADAAPVTIAELLTHAAGLPRSGPWASREPSYRSTEAEVLTAAHELTADPGIRARYSNLGFSVLGVAIARVAREPYRAFVARELLVPLGMTSTTFEPSPGANVAAGYVEAAGHLARAPAIANGAAEGAGGLWSSADDLAKWIRFQLDAWPPRDDADRGPLRRASRRESHVAHLEMDVEATPGRQSRAMGLGWEVERRSPYAHLVEHGGELGGYRTRVVFAPDRGFGFVLLANATSTPMDAIVDRVLAVTSALAPRVDPTEAPAPAANAHARAGADADADAGADADADADAGAGAGADAAAGADAGAGAATDACARCVR